MNAGALHFREQLKLWVEWVQICDFISYFSFLPALALLLSAFCFPSPPLSPAVFTAVIEIHSR